MTLIRSLIQPLIRPLVRSLQEPVISGGGSAAITVVSPIVEIPSLDETGVILSSNASAVDDHYNGQEVAFSGGDVAVVADYVGSTRTLTFVTPFSTGTGPGVGETVTFVPRVLLSSVASVDWMAQSDPTTSNSQPGGIFVPSVNKTFFVWHGEDLKPYIAAYDHATSKMLPAVRISNNSLTADNHGVPVIAADTTETRLYVFWGTHNGINNPGGGIRWAQSATGYDYLTWTELSNFGVGELSTYPLAVFTGGNRYFFSRTDPDDNGVRGLGVWKWDGSSWGSSTELINAGLFGGSTDTWIYPFDFAVDSNGDIHITGAVRYGAPAAANDYANPFHIIYRTADDTVDTLDGTEAISLPLSHTDLDDHAVIEQTDESFYSAYWSNIGIDENDRVWVSYYRKTTALGDWELRFGYHNGTSWVISTVSEITAPGRMAMAVRSSTDIEIIKDGADDNDIEVWNYNGTSWTKTHVLVTGSPNDNTQPKKIVPTNGVGLSPRTEFQWVIAQGDSDDYVNDDLKVWGYGSGAALTGPSVSSGFDINPSTDIAKKSASSVSLVAGTTVLAVCGWVRIDSFVGTNSWASQTIFSIRDATDGWILFCGNSSGQKINISTVGVSLTAVDMSGYTAGSWVHFYALLDETAGGTGNSEVRIVLTAADGAFGSVLDTGKLTIADEPVAADANIMLGNDDVLTQRGLGGRLADVIILDHEPTNAEVVSHAGGSRADTIWTSGVHAYFAMRGEGTESDLSGNESDLTLTGVDRAILKADIPPITELGQ